ncbi:unnamed protein product [Symbiodinium natans]|uniref:Uncharacterized protein n=1 Tax=Symbiodinium natans TaxID=878477 RepID=A0A812K7I6_9DINO|nr:unnamed protein product [Symbiodinium natans]
MGGVYREDLAHSRRQANRFYLVSQDGEDLELLRQRARSLRALGLEPPRAHHFTRLARQGQNPHSPSSLLSLPPSRGSSRSMTSGSAVEGGDTSNTNHPKEGRSEDSVDNSMAGHGSL